MKHRTSMPGATLTRRSLLRKSGVALSSALVAGDVAAQLERYTEEDIEKLANQRRSEQTQSGKGPHGQQIYKGYRGLAKLPWFGLDEAGQLQCTDISVPASIDVHCHLGMSVLFKPRLDLQSASPRVQHLLDCDRDGEACRLDLDVYANSNFTADMLKRLRWNTLTQGLWGNASVRTQTIPNLISEMDAMRVSQAMILPIELGLPFGDDLSERWRAAIESARLSQRLVSGMSVHPRNPEWRNAMRAQAKAGARIIKLHPTVQAFYPDEDSLMPIYEDASRLDLVVFFHGGRAGIEPESRLKYAMPRHYEAALADFPDLQIIFGHAGARDSEATVELALRYENAWLGIHGQGVTRLQDIVDRSGGERLLFGSDWPFYHIGMSLAKVLLCTEAERTRHAREKILRKNALELLPELSAIAKPVET